MSATHKYVVKAGFRHNQGTPEEVGPGGIVELTEEQASAFKDKLAPYHGGNDDVETDLDAVIENLTPFEREVLKHRLLTDEAGEQAVQEVEENLDGMSVKQLTALPEWELVPDPKPTRKANILAAIRAVRAVDQEPDE